MFVHSFIHPFIRSFYTLFLFTVEVEGVRQSGITGDFDVEVAGQLVHSKKGGAGFPDNEDKVNKIVEAIKAAQ